MPKWRPIVEVSINLLPKHNIRKEKRAIYLIPVIGIAVICIATILLMYHYLNTKNSVKELSEKITVQTSARDQARKEYIEKTTGFTEYNFTEKYKQMNQLLHSIYKDTIYVHETIVKLLPDQAKVIGYTYLNNGELTLTATFYSKGDSALFLHRLYSCELVEKAELESITADDEDVLYESIFHLKLNTLAGEEK